MLTPFGLFLFLFSQYYLLGRRFAKDYKEKINAKNELEELNKNLEKKVEDRTEKLQASNAELEATNDALIQTRDALWGEMEIAKKIQTVLLPEKPSITGFEIYAYMNPADEVGGDYYDIINIADKD